MVYMVLNKQTWAPLDRQSSWPGKHRTWPTRQQTMYIARSTGAACSRCLDAYFEHMLMDAKCFRGLRNPQQRTGADGVPVEDIQASGPSTAAELERVNSKVARRAGQKLQWKPLDMSASSDVAEIISPFNQAGPEAASSRISLDRSRL